MSFTESDMFVYVAKMTATEEFIKDDRLGTGPNAVTAFNLLKDNSYVDMLGELLGRVLFSFNVETEWSQDIHAYQAKLEKIRYILNLSSHVAEQKAFFFTSDYF